MSAITIVSLTLALGSLANTVGPHFMPRAGFASPDCLSNTEVVFVLLYNTVQTCLSISKQGGAFQIYGEVL